MKNIILLGIFLVIYIRVNSQTPYNKLEYSYDANGNRISRTIQIVLNKTSNSTFPLIRQQNNEIKQPDLSVNCFPNPSSGHFEIEFKNSIKVGFSGNYSIFSVDGRFVQKKELLFPNTTVDVSSESDGIYLISIQSNFGDYFFRITKLGN